MSTTNLNIRMDKKVKEDAEKIFAELGLNMTSAINIFLRASIRESGIPFALKLDVPNEETLLAIEEAKRIATDDGVEAFDNIDDLRKALDI